MGIRFLCPNGHKLHVKSHLAGRKGVCPTCGAKVVIPQDSAEAGGPGEVAGQQGAEAAAAEPGWFVRGADGEQYGPAPDDLLANWIEEGRIAGDTWVWRESWPEWRQAAEALGQRFPVLVAAPAPLPPPTPAAVATVEPVVPLAQAEPEWPTEDEASSAPAGFTIEIERSDTIARLRKTHARRRLKSTTMWAVTLLSVLALALCGLLAWILLRGAPAG